MPFWFLDDSFFPPPQQHSLGASPRVHKTLLVASFSNDELMSTDFPPGRASAFWAFIRLYLLHFGASASFRHHSSFSASKFQKCALDIEDDSWLKKILPCSLAPYRFICEISRRSIYWWLLYISIRHISRWLPLYRRFIYFRHYRVGRHL